MTIRETTQQHANEQAMFKSKRKGLNRYWIWESSHGLTQIKNIAFDENGGYWGGTDEFIPSTITAGEFARHFDAQLTPKQASDLYTRITDYSEAAVKHSEKRGKLQQKP